MKNKPESQASIPFGTYATIEQVNDEASTRATNDVGILSNLNSFRMTTNNNLTTKQNINDSTLQTSIKTVPGAINELNTKTNTQATSITNLQTQVTNNSNNITTLQGQVASHTTSINNNTSAINQNTTDITNLETQVTTDTNDITDIKTNMSDTNNQLNLKQNISDNTLETTSHTVPGAINELNNKVNDQDTNITSLQGQATSNTNAINQNSSDITSLQTQVTTNTSDITDIKTNMSDTSTNLALKQNITDDTLKTTSHTVSGAINELNNKTNTQSSDITNLQTQVTSNTNAINQNTNAIINSETQVTINTSNITDIKRNMSDTSTNLDLKQNITDDTLETIDNTLPGAINELNRKKINNSDFSIFQETMLQFQDFTNDSLIQKQNIIEPTLETANNTIPEAINEINGKINTQATSISKLETQATSNTTNITNAITQLTASVPIWTSVGTSTNARTWSYNLGLNKKYRVAYNWNSNDQTSKIYKEFVWTGNNIPLETYIDGFIGITIIGFQVLGKANIVEISATTKGVVISTKVGISSIGRIVSLEQSS